MPSTSKYLLPYPTLSEAPNGPQAFQNLANATETALRKAPRGFISTTMDQNWWTPGNQPTASTPAINNDAADLRNYEITAQFQGKAQQAAQTGHTVKLERSIDGFATFTIVGDIFYAVYPASIDCSCACSWIDNSAPASANLRYRLRVEGYGIHGNVFANPRLNVYDAGGR